MMSRSQPLLSKEPMFYRETHRRKWREKGEEVRKFVPNLRIGKCVNFSATGLVLENNGANLEKKD